MAKPPFSVSGRPALLAMLSATEFLIACMLLSLPLAVLHTTSFRRERSRQLPDLVSGLRENFIQPRPIPVLHPAAAIGSRKARQP